ncbi:hypothetical protein [Oleisolibacter albus]|uniref:hypothetical protein n=1 Tax=Oleisolibacter albus TaxID=2171757 RepID=UPI0012D7B134|nr:hypothetical protein [Oleisolibacter albus]
MIEVEDEAVGLAVEDAGGVVFHAVHPVLQSLHGIVFADIVEAQQAAVRAFRNAA